MLGVIILLRGPVRAELNSGVWQRGVSENVLICTPIHRTFHFYQRTEVTSRKTSSDHNVVPTLFESCNLAFSVEFVRLFLDVHCTQLKVSRGRPSDAVVVFLLSTLPCDVSSPFLRKKIIA